MEVIGRGFGLPEGPCYDPDTGHLFVTDASAGGVWRVPVDGGPAEVVVPHRRGIAGLALHADGGFVVSGRNLAWKRGTKTVVLAEVGFFGPGARFNDLTTSSTGRVYAGSIDLDPEGGASAHLGSLVMVDLEGMVHTVAAGLSQSNGLAFSPDGRWLYHVDSGPRTLLVYEVNLDGTLSDGHEFYRWPSGIPDGMAAAADGSLWVALAEVDGRGFLSLVDSDGRERDRIEMPHPGVKSLCFGGEDLRTVFVTLAGDMYARQRDGFVIRFQADVAGAPTERARVRPVAQPPQQGPA